MTHRSAPAAREVRCPECGRASLWSPDNPYRPFCSARCKQIDLGAWASESYRVPVVERDDGELPDLPTESADDSGRN